MTYLPFLAGVVLHHAYYIHGEHHLNAARYVGCTVAGFLALTLIVVCALGHGLQTSLEMAAGFWLKYLVGLYGSIVIYRAFFHRLHRFRGPKLAKVSKLWHVFQARRLDNTW